MYGHYKKKKVYYFSLIFKYWNKNSGMELVFFMRPRDESTHVKTRVNACFNLVFLHDFSFCSILNNYHCI